MLLIKEAKQLYLSDDDLEVSLKANVFAIDATTIDLCLSTFYWATFRSTKGGIKLHTQIDLKTSIPEFILFSTASVHDVNVLDVIHFEANSFYIMDRGYVDYKRLYKVHSCEAFFVTRAKDNMNYRRLYSKQKDMAKGVMYTRINDAPVTIYMKYSILSQFCKYMCKAGYDCYIPRLPATPPKDSFTPYIFTNKDMEEIFQACDHLQLYDKHMSTSLFMIPAMIRLLYGTGLRISEALTLKNKDVDFEKECLYIRKSKNGDERIAPLSETLAKVLQQYLQYRDRIPISCLNDPNLSFFVSPIGSSCIQGTVYRWFRKVLATCGIPHQGDHKGPRVHDLRHYGKCKIMGSAHQEYFIFHDIYKNTSHNLLNVIYTNFPIDPVCFL